MKKSSIFIILLFLIPLIAAQNYKMDISTSKETFNAGENITIKVVLYDSQNKLINDNVNVILEDAEKKVKIEKTIISNYFVDVELPPGASHGQGTIIAKYKEEELKGTFLIEAEELVRFEIDGEKLIITNIGNTQYSRTIQITIGDVTGIKNPKLKIGEKISYRLVAPEGTYNIRVSDGKTTKNYNNVMLTGTGNVVGAIDESASQRTGITGGISPDEEMSFLSYVKDSKFIYVFILVIFGAMILIAIERKYRKKARG